MITLNHDGPVRVLTMDRPEARNALSRAGFAELNSHLNDAVHHEETRVVVWTGAAGHFTAGNDLGELRDIDVATLSSHPFHALVETMASFPKPLVAAVEGVAVGAGVTLLAHADFVVTTTTARYRTPFAALGVPAEGASSALLPLVVGPRMAARLLLAGEWVSGVEAAACGLATVAVPEGQALAEALALAGRLGQLPPAAVTATKRLLLAARQEAVAGAAMRERLLGLPLYAGLAERPAVQAVVS
jgi:enoyl-CoA hydratase/carnithine racemase